MARTGLLAEQRRTFILETLSTRGSVSVSELHRRLEVSRETIRRDITRLAGENKLRKTHGGALSVDSHEPSLTERLSVNMDGKRKIGEAAAELVPDGSSVIIDAGSTTLCVAEALSTRQNLTVYTNDMQVAACFSGGDNNRVFLIGGEVHEGAAYGQDALSMLDHYYADFAFIGVSAMSVHPWITEYTRPGADLHGMMLSHSRTSVLLVDKTKFDKIAPVRMPNVEKATYVLVDEHPGEQIASTAQELDVELRVV
jgi:DeoR family transcriptional regulator, glycerol-3-phosphate regulon repressor